MSVIVRVIGAAAGIRTPHDGRYVVAWNAHTPYGTLELTSTDDPAEAYRFADAAEALRDWQTISAVEPYRSDGKPNRPLTGIHIGLTPC